MHDTHADDLLFFFLEGLPFSGLCGSFGHCDP
jgi:hypothetical protein